MRNHSACVQDRLRIGPQIDERKRAQEIAQDSKLVAKRGAAAAGAVWRCVGAILVARVERIVEMIENAAAREHEIPGLAQIGGVFVAQESSLIIRERLAKTVVGEHDLRIRIVKIDDAHAGEKFPHRRVKVAVILREEMLVGKRGLFAADPFEDASLPRE